MAEHDVIVVGGGHNGLICAGYLAKAGLDVLVLERREIIGGCCVTEELFPGYQIDRGAASIIWIHTTPVLKDLAVDKQGLEWVELDPMIFAPYQDGRYVAFYSDINKTCDVISRLSQRDADQYMKLYRFWTEVGELLDGMSLNPILPDEKMGVADTLKKGWQMLRSGPTAQLGEKFAKLSPLRQLEIQRLMVTSAKKILEENFETDYVKSQIAWIGATAGLDPAEMGTGGLVGHHFMLHGLGIKRPIGGAGALTQAIGRAIQTHGATIRTGASVKSILIDGGKANGVELESGEKIAAKRVIAACAPTLTFLKLVGAEHLDRSFVKKVEGIRIINGMGLGVYLGLDELPRYSVDPDENSVTTTRSLQSLCPTIEHISQSYMSCAAGVPSPNYSMHISTPTALDPTLAPEGKHIMWIWTMFAPYQLSNGKTWEDLREREADRVIDIVSQYAPNIKQAINNRFVMTPVDYENVMAIPKGQYGHIDMSLDQMYWFRPLIEVANYSTPIADLYLTGAGTHPGGGVYGGPGYTTAQWLLKEMARSGGA